jgi:sodium transport system permease protein
MSWSNVKLIFLREVRDQLRDRRTLFMIAVLPLLLYPLMGMVILQVSQFRREHPVRIWLIGAEQLPAAPQMLADDHFAPSLGSTEELRLIDLTVAPAPESERAAREVHDQAQRAMEAGTYDAVVYFPAHFAAEMEKFRAEVLNGAAEPMPPAAEQLEKLPQPEIFVNTARDKSRVAFERMERILHRWRQEVVALNLAARHVPVQATRPFEVVNIDIAQDSSRRAAVWSRILPFVVIVWALTGAFYPAIDLCAGEKERGTLETLLSSPAQRSEIVWGKLLTVMTFSVATSLLNLASLAGTGGFVISRMQHLGVSDVSLELGPPPLAPLLWLVVALLPLSAMFSALSLAVAAFAKSSKEGQYYLMPLLLVTLPLMLFPMLPGTELEMGTAIIPVTGVIFLLRELMEGRLLEAARYALPVIGVTAVCCLLAIRWAIDQFNNESVLFRESERLDLRLWLRHLVRDRGETPTIGEAMLCGILILILQFFVSLAAPEVTHFGAFAAVTLTLQIAVIAAPALLMAVMLTSRPRQTLLLTWPRWRMLPMAAALAVLLHPCVLWLSQGIYYLYPVSEETLEKLQGLQHLVTDQPVWAIVLLMALTPAICEELAFRGFILSGLRHSGHRWVAIALSSFFFGVTHSMLQQQLSAFFVGLVIGYIALRSGSLLPGMLFHFTHNSLLLTMQSWLRPLRDNAPVLADWVTLTETEAAYHPVITVLCGAGALALLYWLHRQPYAPSAEERLQQALDHQTPLTPKTAWRLW